MGTGLKYKDDIPAEPAEPRESSLGICCHECEWFANQDEEGHGDCQAPLPDSITDLGFEVCMTLLMHIEEPKRRRMHWTEGTTCPLFAEIGSTG